MHRRIPRLSLGTPPDPIIPIAPHIRAPSALLVVLEFSVVGAAPLQAGDEGRCGSAVRTALFEEQQDQDDHEDDDYGARDEDHDGDCAVGVG
ncbi:hypothetical protein OPT61_g9321 [Boeremia exigua]|uniref:Uncharacterized protein n=1 Tax=Boeremia exigua TaxID=749465 RepID=A0ACC2HVH0_9PLEO|nr:hypothetical protein OPT61_g9321 [Boeremia exigua]